MTQGIVPFDDPSGQQFLDWLADKGGAPSNVTTIVAAGTTLDDATPVPPGTVYVSTTPASSGVKLASATLIGQVVSVINDGANTLNVYPPNSSDLFIGSPAGDPITISAHRTGFFLKVTNSGWWAY